jgi:hypothetical protein
MDRTEQIKQQMAAKVATFKVGDLIEFHVYDDTGCTETTGDPLEIPLVGTILSITGDRARVEHEYGIAIAWLPIAKKLEIPECSS